MVPFKNLSNFWRTLEIPFINYETNLISTWSEKSVLSNDTKAVDNLVSFRVSWVLHHYYKLIELIDKFTDYKLD